MPALCQAYKENPVAIDSCTRFSNCDRTKQVDSVRCWFRNYLFQLWFVKISNRDRIYSKWLNLQFFQIENYSCRFFSRYSLSNAIIPDKFQSFAKLLARNLPYFHTHPDQLTNVLDSFYSGFSLSRFPSFIFASTVSSLQKKPSCSDRLLYKNFCLQAIVHAWHTIVHRSFMPHWR